MQSTSHNTKNSTENPIDVPEPARDLIQLAQQTGSVSAPAPRKQFQLDDAASLLRAWRQQVPTASAEEQFANLTRERARFAAD